MKSRPTKIFIGIDPAFRENGFSMAIIDLSDRTINIYNFKKGFLDFCSWFLHESPENAIVGVENSNLQNVTFYSHRDKRTHKLLTKWQARYNSNAVPLSADELAKKSRDAGKNQAISQNTVDLCKTKYKILDISPKEKGAKWNSNQFKQHLKINKLIITKKGRSNQDDRDASKIAIMAMNRWYEAK